MADKKVYIVVEGGFVQDVYSEADGLNIIIIDKDLMKTEDTDTTLYMEEESKILQQKIKDQTIIQHY